LPSSLSDAPVRDDEEKADVARILAALAAEQKATAGSLEAGVGIEPASTALQAAA
jgi:hypothetical protein